MLGDNKDRLSWMGFVESGRGEADGVFMGPGWWIVHGRGDRLKKTDIRIRSHQVPTPGTASLATLLREVNDGRTAWVLLLGVSTFCRTFLASPCEEVEVFSCGQHLARSPSPAEVAVRNQAEGLFRLYP